MVDLVNGNLFHTLFQVNGGQKDHVDQEQQQVQ